MDETEGGRQCDKCAHDVVDFTDHDQQSILDTLKNAKGRVCGRFRPDQIVNTAFKDKIRVLRRFCIAAILAFGLSLFNMPKSLAASLKQVSEDSFNVTQVEVVNGEIIIRGTVIEKDTGEPLPFVTIHFEGKNGVVGCTSDFDGNYMLKFSEEQMGNKDITLNVRYIGYDEIKIEIPAKKLKPDVIYVQDIRMESQSCLGMPIIVVEKDFHPYSNRTENLTFEDEDW